MPVKKSVRLLDETIKIWHAILEPVFVKQVYFKTNSRFFQNDHERRRSVSEKMVYDIVHYLKPNETGFANFEFASFKSCKTAI